MCAVLAMAVTGKPSQAAVWGVSPRASVAVRYDSNLQLRADDENDSVGGSATAGAHIVRYGDTVDWKFDPQLLLVRYRDDTDLNRTESQIDAAVERRLELSQWTATASYVRDTTLTSELGSSGITQVNLPHEHIVVALSPALQLNERCSAGLQGSWSNDRYLGAGASGLVDYDYGVGFLQLACQATQRSDLAVDASYARLTASSVRYETEQLAANLRWDVSLSERWKLSLAGGPLRVRSSIAIDNGIGYSVELSGRAETSRLNLSWSQDTSPNGRGALSKRDRVVLSAGRQFGARLSADLTGQWLHNEDAVQQIGLSIESIRYVYADTTLRWLVSPTVSSFVSIGWSRQAQQTTAIAGHGYHVAVGMAWQALERGH